MATQETPRGARETVGWRCADCDFRTQHDYDAAIHKASGHVVNRVVSEDMRSRMIERALDAHHPHRCTYDVDKRERLRARYEMIIDAVLPELHSAALGVVAPVTTPCRCGCGRVGGSRDYAGFASRDCLERGEER